MKVVIERAALLKSTGHTQSVVERRNTVPILSNLLITAENGEISAKATDQDIEIIERAPARVETPGSCTVSAHLLHEIVRKLPDGAEVLLDGGEGTLSVAAGRSRFTLPTLPGSDFPVMTSGDFQAEFMVASAVLRRLFSKASFAVSTEETRYYLNGIYLHACDHQGAMKLRAVATDGHRLARIDAALPEGAQEMPGVIVPRKTVGELRKLLEEDSDVAIAVSETKIRFTFGNLVLTSKVIDGSFPDYARVIPQKNDRRLDVDAALFAKAVDRVSTISAERTRSVKLSVEKDRLQLSVVGADSGSAVEELAVAFEGEPIETGFNAKYLLEITSQVDGDIAVFMFAQPSEPTLVQEGDDDSAIYVVMPMRV